VVAISPCHDGQQKQEDTMSFYEAARRVQKQREMEKFLEEMRQAMAQLERMIQEGEIH
jgi:ABC-type Fe3+-citrate transport system substrate-binding protein